MTQTRVQVPVCIVGRGPIGLDEDAGESVLDWFGWRCVLVSGSTAYTAVLCRLRAKVARFAGSESEDGRAQVGR